MVEIPINIQNHDESNGGLDLMKLVIFGATGKTGNEIVRQALQKGHHVTAFVRDPARMGVTHDHLSIQEGDVLDPDRVREAIQDHDAVICSLGSSELGKTSIRSQGTANIVQAMDETRGRRLLVVSAMGVAESWSTLSLFGKLIFATLLRSARLDHEEQERVVRASEVDWTIVRPSGLTDDPASGNYMLGENIRAKTSRIARADVANFIITELSDNAYLRKAVTITE
jgi:putative NADH-flavin reductase